MKQRTFQLTFCRGFLLFAILLGVVPAFWGGIENGDSVRYLAMARGLAAGNGQRSISGLWSPLYPVLQGVALFVFRPQWDRQLWVPYTVNFIIYIVSVGCFGFFWNRVFRLYRNVSNPLTSETTRALLSERSFWALGYALFLSSHLPLVGLGTPDLLLAAIINLSGGILLQIRSNGWKWTWSVAFGVTLGLGYLAKAVLFPLSFCFLACTFWRKLPARQSFLAGLVALGMFLAVCSPFIWALSRKEGTVTIGDSGWLNYAWHVNRIPGLNWQGQPAGFGTPLHPTIRILDFPEAYEFPGFPDEIYPPFDNPSYWNDGLKPRFILSDQLRSWKINLRESAKFLWLQSPVLVGVFLTVGMVQNARETARQLAGMWYLWLPVLAAILIFVTVHWEDRYIGPFVVMGWAPFLCLIRLPGNLFSRRLLKCMVIVVTSVMILQAFAASVSDASQNRRQTEQNLAIARGLHAAGFGPKQKIAEVDGYVALWEWLVPVTVVAEITREYPPTSPPVTPAGQSKIYDRLASTGASALVSDSIPRWAENSDWKEIGNSPMYFRSLEERREPVRASGQ